MNGRTPWFVFLDREMYNTGCVPIFVFDTVQPDASQSDQDRKSFRLLGLSTANAALQKNGQCYCVSKKWISVRVKWGLEVFMLTSFIGQPWSNV
jgi:hypothetical protein